jgi:hypothetical protein
MTRIVRYQFVQNVTTGDDKYYFVTVAQFYVLSRLAISCCNQRYVSEQINTNRSCSICFLSPATCNKLRILIPLCANPHVQLPHHL